MFVVDLERKTSFVEYGEAISTVVETDAPPYDTVKSFKRNVQPAPVQPVQRMIRTTRFNSKTVAKLLMNILNWMSEMLESTLQEVTDLRKGVLQRRFRYRRRESSSRLQVKP
jgi:hypothetical protein